MSGTRGRVAVLGSGLTAAAVVAALLESGRRVRMWGATPSAYLTAFTELGAVNVRSPREAARGADVVVLAPADDGEQLTIAAELRGRLAGTTVLTVHEPADDGGWAADWATRDGVDQLDCVLFGNPIGIGSTSVVILVGGPPALVRRHRTLLDDLGVAIPVGGPSAGARRTEVALLGLWYDVNVAVLRALANIDPSARPVLALELRAILAQLPGTIRSVDTGGAMPEDAGLAMHARALDTVNTARSRAGSRSTELEEAAREITSLLGREDPRSPLTRIAQGLRWPDETPSP